ncbi:MAG TPA: FAD/NAD(P)-binding oxidoreductase [Gaiella sp.]|jgi:NTE family protein
MTDTIVVVGGGLAAASLAVSYREAGGEEVVTILSADDRPPYNRPPLSKGFLRGEMEDEADAYVQPARFYDDNVIELRLETEVRAVDTGAHEIELAGGERVPYGTLVIASGATPRSLPLPGMDLVGLHTYRTLADATAVREAAAEARKALVVGGSFIGSEVAASLRMRGLEVALVEMGERLMPALGSAELSEQLAALYREQGVHLLLGDALEELHSNGRLLTGARTAQGHEVEAYLGVVGVGVEPNVSFLDPEQLKLDNGVVVDERFRSSADDVYAIGDVAQFPDPVFGRPRRIEHWSNANAQGSHLGRQLAGAREPWDEISVFFTQLFDVKLQVLGDVDGGVDDVLLLGSIDEGRLAGFHRRDGKVVGAVLHGQSADVVEQAKTILREQPEADDAEALLADPRFRPATAARG